ncbi:MAG TPA: hypothetical protein DIT64_19815 [Verrucomicrobiales bacterium]|nr:hypothetical protein [Verrucomicrobiales bacterium]
MISRYNKTQFIKAVLFFLWGMFCCWLAYLFFRYAAAFLCAQFGLATPGYVPVLAGFLGLAAAWVTGYGRWKTGGGLFSYHESALYHDLDGETAGACVADFYAHRVTGPAYMLGQVFMAGPLSILRAWTLLRSRLPVTPGLEKALEDTLAMLQAANKWQGLDEYPANKKEILHLAQMDLIDFSAFKGAPRFKAR